MIELKTTLFYAMNHENFEFPEAPSRHIRYRTDILGRAAPINAIRSALSAFPHRSAR